MSYANIPQSDYSVLYPDSMTHAGSCGWKRAPIPSWGENPFRAGPSAIGETQEERDRGMALAMQAAGAAAVKAADRAGIVGSAQQQVSIEDKAIVVNPEVTAMRADYAKVSIWPFLAIGGAGIVGASMLIYAMRKRHG